MKKILVWCTPVFVWTLLLFGCTENGSDPVASYEELPSFCDIDNSEGWSNIRISKDGTAIFTSNDSASKQVQKAFMLLPTDTLGVVSIYGEYDETGFPKCVVFNDAVVFIDNHSDTTFDASLFIDGVPVWTATNLALSNSETRAWSDNNWVRNTCAVGGVITSAVGIGMGVGLTATGVGAGVGLASIAAGSYSLYRNLEVLFGPPEYQMDPLAVDMIKEFGVDALMENLSKSNQDYLSKYLENYLDKKGLHLSTLKGLSLADFGMFAVDQIWGKTTSELQKFLALVIAHRSYVVETRAATEVTEHTAVLHGFISPESVSPLGQYAEIEYGIVVYPTANPSDRMHQYDIVGDGGEFSLLFRGLEYNTQYSYFVYYYNKDHTLRRFGETRTFITLGEENIRDMLIKFYHDTGGDNWLHNDNWCSEKPLNQWYGVSLNGDLVWDDDEEEYQIVVDKNIDVKDEDIRSLILELSGNNLVGAGDLSGCEKLIYLDCDDNYLSALNVLSCSALSELSCYNNQLTSLYISGCATLKYLECSENQLNSLDVSDCSALVEMGCSDNYIERLALSGCNSLEVLYCGENHLTMLDVSGCVGLEALFCERNELEELALSNCKALDNLNCSHNDLDILDVSACTVLEYLACNSNSLDKLLLPSGNSLNYLYCDNNYLTSLDMSACTALEYLRADSNALTSLDVSACRDLFDLSCGYNYNLNSLNVSGCSALVYLSCNNCPLSSLDVSGCHQLGSLNLSETVLKEFSCHSPMLTSIDLLGCNELESLNLSGTALLVLTCNNGVLTSLNVLGCSTLVELNCVGNKLTSLDVSDCSALKQLNCDGNQLTSLDVSDCSALKQLNCDGNQLTSLDVSNKKALSYLSVGNNPLVSLDLSGTALEQFTYDNYDNNDLLTTLNMSGCTALRWLYCDYNQLTSLNVSGCSALETLECDNNKLTSLNVSGCSALKVLHCENNKLTSLDAASCSSLRSLYCHDNPITQQITPFYDALNWFECDRRYYIAGNAWWFRYSDGHGWYYADETAGLNFRGYYNE